MRPALVAPALLLCAHFPAHGQVCQGIHRQLPRRCNAGRVLFVNCAARQHQQCRLPCVAALPARSISIAPIYLFAPVLRLSRSHNATHPYRPAPAPHRHRTPARLGHARSPLPDGSCVLGDNCSFEQLCSLCGDGQFVLFLTFMISEWWHMHRGWHRRLHMCLPQLAGMCYGPCRLLCCDLSATVTTQLFLWFYCCLIVIPRCCLRDRLCLPEPQQMQCRDLHRSVSFRQAPAMRRATPLTMPVPVTCASCFVLPAGDTSIPGAYSCVCPGDPSATFC